MQLQYDTMNQQYDELWHTETPCKQGSADKGKGDKGKKGSLMSQHYPGQGEGQHEGKGGKGKKGT